MQVESAAPANTMKLQNSEEGETQQEDSKQQKSEHNGGLKVRSKDRQGGGDGVKSGKAVVELSDSEEAMEVEECDMNGKEESSSNGESKVDGENTGDRGDGEGDAANDKESSSKDESHKDDAGESEKESEAELENDGKVKSTKDSNGKSDENKIEPDKANGESKNDVGGEDDDDDVEVIDDEDISQSVNDNDKATDAKNVSDKKECDSPVVENDENTRDTLQSEDTNDSVSSSVRRLTDESKVEKDKDDKPDDKDSVSEQSVKSDKIENTEDSVGVKNDQKIEKDDKKDKDVKDDSAKPSAKDSDEKDSPKQTKDASAKSDKDKNDSSVKTKGDSENGLKKKDTPDKSDVPKKKEDIIKTVGNSSTASQPVSKVEKAMEKPDTDSELRPVAQLLCGLGLDLARQQIYKDLIKVQNRKQAQQKLDDKEVQQLDKLKSAYDELLSKNEPYYLGDVECDDCGFKTDSKSVLALHKEHPHDLESGHMECAMCDYQTKSVQEFFFHMEAEHNRKGRVVWKRAFFVCHLCPYENNSKYAMNKHRLKCDKTFKLKRNLEPTPADCDIPLKKPKPRVPPPTVKPPQIAPRPNVQQNAAAKTNNVQLEKYLKDVSKQQGRVQGYPSAYQQQPGVPYPGYNQRAAQQWPQQQGLPQARAGTLASGHQAQQPAILLPRAQPNMTSSVGQTYMMGGQMYTLVQTNGQFMLQPMPAPGAATATVGQPRPARPSLPNNPHQLHPPVLGTATTKAPPPLTRAPIQRPAAAMQPTSIIKPPAAVSGPKPASQTKADGFEICEICGGFVKDRESLRIHFYWAHKVDIHKDIFSRKQPHLACDFCTQRFWTYQGLNRHRSLQHPKQTPGTQKCYLCGATNITNLLGHMTNIHNITLQTMFKQKKCLVCGSDFGDEKAQEQHMLTAHGDLFKSQPSPANKKSPAGKGVAPVPTGLFENTVIKKPVPSKKKYGPECSICDISFPDMETFSKHCNEKHVFKCSRCSEKFAAEELRIRHYNDTHRSDKDPCQVCGVKVTIGRPTIRHIKREHLKDCSVVVPRLGDKKFKFYNDQRLQWIEFQRNKNKKKKEPTVVVLDSSSDEDDEPLSKRLAAAAKPTNVIILSPLQGTRPGPRSAKIKEKEKTEARKDKEKQAVNNQPKRPPTPNNPTVVINSKDVIDLDDDEGGSVQKAEFEIDGEKIIVEMQAEEDEDGGNSEEPSPSKESSNKDSGDKSEAKSDGAKDKEESSSAESSDVVVVNKNDKVPEVKVVDSQSSDVEMIEKDDDENNKSSDVEMVEGTDKSSDVDGNGSKDKPQEIDSDVEEVLDAVIEQDSKEDDTSGNNSVMEID